jgi:WD40 repeat protein
VSNSGVAAVAVHPERRHIAVAEKGKDPSIYIYRSTDWKIVRILRKGTERAYSDIQFSHDGKKLASVGNEPGNE